MSQDPAAPTRRLQALTIFSVVIAVAALALAAWAILRDPSPSASETTYSDTQKADAKTKACQAFATVRDGVARNTNLQVPGGDADVTGALAVAANARVSLYDGGQYLLQRVDPATPADLKGPVEKFANGLMDIGAAATAGVQNTDPAQAGRLKDADTLSTSIGGLCQ